MDTKAYITQSEQETRDVARQLLLTCKSIVPQMPVAILLYGTLGAGKTAFVKGIGDSLSIDDISSPTFVLIHEYELKGPIKKLVHIDLYRVTEKSEFDHLGIEKDMNPGVLFCIEWSENIEPIIDLVRAKCHIVSVTLEHKDEKSRRIKISSISL